MDGAMTAERFDDWVLHELIPCLRPNQVVVLDNLRAHHSRVARNLTSCPVLFLGVS
jgi:hypothetical protein